MTDSIKYLLFCEHYGLLAFLIFLAGIILFVSVLITRWRQRRLVLFISCLLMLLGLVGLARTLTTGEQEISQVQYQKLAREAKLTSGVDRYMKQYLLKDGSINKLHYCMLMSKINSEKPISRRKVIKGPLLRHD